MSEIPASPWFVEQQARKRLMQQTFPTRRPDWVLLALYILFAEGCVGLVWLWSLKP